MGVLVYVAVVLAGIGKRKPMAYLTGFFVDGPEVMYALVVLKGL